MTRNAAREIAMHLSYELSFTDLTAEELLDARLTEGRFSELAPEYEVYGQTPGPRQRTYIRKAVSGVAVHGYELDRYIEKYAKGWRFERIPLVASAIMRLAMFEILYMPEILYHLWRFSILLTLRIAENQLTMCINSSTPPIPNNT